MDIPYLWIGKIGIGKFQFSPNWHKDSTQFQLKSRRTDKNWQAYLKLDMEMQGVKNIKDHFQEQSGKTYTSKYQDLFECCSN